MVHFKHKIKVAPRKRSIHQREKGREGGTEEGTEEKGTESWRGRERRKERKGREVFLFEVRICQWKLFSFPALFILSSFLYLRLTF